MVTQCSAPTPGVYVPTLTFFKEDETVDFEAMETHVLRLAKSGINGIVIQGSNGEAVHLDADERKEVISRFKKVLQSNGFSDVVITAGTGAHSFRETLRLTKDAAEAGAQYAVVLPPNYWAAATKPHLIKFFNEIADQSPIPIIIYNFPGVCNGIDLDSATLLELSKHPNIAGCKLTCANIGKTHRVATHTDPKKFSVLAGKSEVFLHSLVAGASGVIAGTANLAPKTHVELWKAWQAGDMVKAKKLQDLFSDIDTVIPVLGLGCLKYLISRYYGYGNGVSRQPLPHGTAEKVAANEAGIKALMDVENSW